jgi:colicin import membrane protein
VKQFTIDFHVQLKQDGSLQTTPTAMTTPQDPYQRVFLESALRAIIECAPYRLPPAFFAEWQNFIPYFGSEDRI